MVPGVKVGELNDIAALDTLVDDKTCGVIVEPIQGEGGVYEASDEFLTALRERCNKVGAVLIYDEIQVQSLVRLIAVWSISDRQVVGSPPLPSLTSSGYPHHGKTPRKWFPNWCNNGLHRHRRRNQSRRSSIPHHID